MSCVNIKKYQNRMTEERKARRETRALHVQSVDEFLKDKGPNHFGAFPTQANGYEIEHSSQCAQIGGYWVAPSYDFAAQKWAREKNGESDMGLNDHEEAP
jgi:hypothetical protein